MRDAKECINSVGYTLFAIIIAIFSNPNGLEIIINKKSIKTNINRKKGKKTRYGEVV